MILFTNFSTIFNRWDTYEDPDLEKGTNSVYHFMTEEEAINFIGKLFAKKHFDYYLNYHYNNNESKFYDQYYPMLKDSIKEHFYRNNELLKNNKFCILSADDDVFSKLTYSFGEIYDEEGEFCNNFENMLTDFYKKHKTKIDDLFDLELRKLQEVHNQKVDEAMEKKARELKIAKDCELKKAKEVLEKNGFKVIS